MYVVTNNKISLTFDVSMGGLALVRISDVMLQRDYLDKPSTLFEFAVNNGIPQDSYSNAGLSVLEVTQSDGMNLRVVLYFAQNEIWFEILITIEADAMAVVVLLTVSTASQSKLFLRLVFPRILGITVPGNLLICAVPQEAGRVLPLAGLWSRGMTLGMPFDIDIGLPVSRNSMELACIFADSGGGVFFCDLDGDLDNGIMPLQFNLSASSEVEAAVVAFWVGEISADSPAQLSRLAIGVHPGDWHAAVDFYTSAHRPRWSFPEIPEWFRDAGAIYCAQPGGAGSIYLTAQGLSDPAPLTSFYELPRLLDQALFLGTNILYLNDYWENEYLNKGDYVPRWSLGGSEALKKGIADVQEKGGRVILYLEPFVIYRFSEVGLLYSDDWGGRGPDGNLLSYNGDSRGVLMVSALPQWQTWIELIAKSLIRDLGADGIYLDSYAWQMNRPMYCQAGGFYDARAYSWGALDLTRRLRETVQLIKQDAIVVGETTAGPIARYWDGGLCNDFGDFAGIGNIGKLIASPVRYGIPEVRFFASGNLSLESDQRVGLNQTYQVFAAGHGLALTGGWPDSGSFMWEWGPFIRALVDIRSTFADVLIHGAQISQPPTGCSDVIAYLYLGRRRRMVTIVNTGVVDVLSNVELNAVDAKYWYWEDLLTGDKFVTEDGVLQNVYMPAMSPRSLRVLLRLPRIGSLTTA